MRELLQGLESAQCETIWLGTTSAILEAQQQLPSFAQGGATVGYTATAQGVSYGLRGMSASVGAVRSGTSARVGMADYTSATEDTAGTVADAWLAKLRTARMFPEER